MKQNMKKGLLLLIGIMVVVFVAACGSDNSTSDSENSGTNEGEYADYPEKRVEIIVPFGAGDSMDLSSHAIAKEFEKITGQQLIVNNQPGGSGVPGTMKMVKSDADGYTLGMIPSGQLIVRPLTQDVNYNLDDFTAIIGVGDFQMHPVAAADAPYDTVAEMADYYNENTEETLKVGTPGVNTYSHIFAEQVADKTGIDYEHLPFDGGPAVVSQILGGHVDIGVINVSNVAQDVKSGNLKILGFPTAERVERFPDVPTVQEQGIDIVGGPTFGIYGPSDMPEEIVDTLYDLFSQALETESYKKFAENSYIRTTNTKPDVMMEEIQAEIDKVSEIIE